MKRKAVLLFIILGIKTVGYSQDFALKTNGLYWATWTFRESKKMHLLLVQPEMKYWLCEKYEGHFVGIHLHGAQFYGGFGSKLYDGYLAGGGVTYGYDWILSPHWNLEAAIGVGYAHLWYKQSPNLPCIKCQEKKNDNYIGPTKAALSLVYIF